MSSLIRHIRRAGLKEQADEMCDRIYQSGSYTEALGVIGEYVNIASADDVDKGETEGMEMNV